MGIRRVESGLERGRGWRLFRRAWIPESPRRALVVVHGLAEHSGRYDHFGEWFAARQSVVHAYDQRGHGRTPGRRGHVDRFEDLHDDLEAVIAAVREEHPDLPVTIVGHSMGGLVTASFACERDPQIASIVLSGPALSIPGSSSGIRSLGARLLGHLMPRFSMESGIPPSAISRDEEVVRRYLEDPLVFGTMTLRFASELMSALARTGGGGGDVKVPMLLLHGEEDRLCLVQGSRDFHASLEVPGSAIRLYPGLHHEIFNEPEQEQVFEDLLGWVRGQEEGVASGRLAGSPVSREAHS